MESLECPYSKSEIFAARLLTSIVALLVVLMVLFGLYGSLTKWYYVLFSIGACAWWFFASQFFYGLISIDTDCMAVAYLIWTRRIPLKNVSVLSVTSHNSVKPFRLKTRPSENISIRLKGARIRSIRFQRLPKEWRVGDFLIERVQSANPDADIRVR